MGPVMLDITFRIEKAFKMRVSMNWMDRLGLSWNNPGKDATLGEFHRLVLQLCDEQKVSPPADSWVAVVRVIEDATGMQRAKITTETKLIEHIAPYG